MKHDQKMVALFLDKYNELTHSSFRVREWVDVSERNKPAVEAIALDEMGTSLAIEHTLLQLLVVKKTTPLDSLLLSVRLKKTHH